MSSKRIAATAALVLILASVAAVGCGGGDDNGGGNKLSATDQLKLAQAKADVEEFCSVFNAPKTSDLYDRAYFTSLDAVNIIIAYNKKDGDKIFVDKVKKLDLPVKRVAENAANELAKCGKDGKDEAAKLRAALQAG
jgi:hypothetical protein